MALSPRGVAALSSPSILALKFIIIEPIEGSFLGISGNNLENNGETALVSNPIAPPFSPIRIMPSQRHIAPVRYNDSSKPTLAEDERLSIMSFMTV